MLNKTLTSALAGSALALGLVVAGNATAGICDVSDVQFAVNPLELLHADACQDPSLGNDNLNDGSSLHDFLGQGGDWEGLAKWDLGDPDADPVEPDEFTQRTITVENVASITFELLSLGLSGDNQYNQFRLNWTYDPIINLALIPVTMDFNFVVKQGSGFAEYFFDDQILTASGDPVTGFGQGQFLVSFLCTGNTTTGNCSGLEDTGTDFSHLSVYGRNFTPYSNGDDNGGGGGGGGTPVPEPATLGLLGLGMLAMGALRRRKVALKS